MKVKQNDSFIILIIILIITIVGIIISLYMQQKPNINNNLEEIKYSGQLIDENSVLEDSGIIGEDIQIDEKNIYYTYLNENEKKLYKQIYANMINLKETFIPVVDLKLEDVLKVYQFVTYDNPELFWLSNGFSYKHNKDDILKQITLYFNGLQYEYEENKNKFEDVANIIIEEASKLKTDYEKEKYVYEILTKNTTYDKKAFYNQTAYSALVNHKTVCAGYSKAFQYIMKKLNIITYYIVGEANKENHAWNIVKLDDGYYNIDLTWEEFNKTDNQLNKTHARGEYAKLLPICNVTTYSVKSISSEETIGIKKEEKTNKDTIIKNDSTEKTKIKNQEETPIKEEIRVDSKTNQTVQDNKSDDIKKEVDSNKIISDNIANDTSYGNVEEVEEEIIDDTTDFKKLFFRVKENKMQ